MALCGSAAGPSLVLAQVLRERNARDPVSAYGEQTEGSHSQDV